MGMRMSRVRFSISGFAGLFCCMHHVLLKLAVASGNRKHLCAQLPIQLHSSAMPALSWFSVLMQGFTPTSAGSGPARCCFGMNS